MNEQEIADEIVRLMGEERAVDIDPTTIATSELVAKKGWSDDRARRYLAKCVDAGILERAMISRADGWGSVKRVKGYKLVAKGGDDAPI